MALLLPLLSLLLLLVRFLSTEFVVSPLASSWWLPLLLKMLHSYHLQLMLFPGMDWQKKLPSADGARMVPIIGEQMMEFHCIAIEALDPLQGFVNQTPNVFRFGPDLMMPESAFVEEYNNFRRNRLQLPKTKWTQDHYQIVFDSLQIRRDTAEMQDPQTGSFKVMAVLVGLALVEGE